MEWKRKAVYHVTGRHQRQWDLRKDRALEKLKKDNEEDNVGKNVCLEPA